MTTDKGAQTQGSRLSPAEHSSGTLHLTCEDLLGPRPCPTPLHRLWYLILDGPLTWMVLCFVVAPIMCLLPLVCSAILFLSMGMWGCAAIPLTILGMGVIVPTEHVPRSLPWITGPITRMMVRYFQQSIVVEDVHQLASPGWLAAIYPHGIFPLQMYTLPFLWWKMSPSQPMHGLCSSNLLTIPLHRYLTLMVGGLSATADNFKREREAGRNTCLVPGGLAECFMVRDDRELMYLRRGFIREAIKNGYDIIPIYHFNLTKILRYMVPQSLLPLCESVSRRTWFLALPYCGRFCLPIPYAVSIKCVFGKRIPVTRCAEPSEEMVEEVASALVTAITGLYYRHRTDDRDMVVFDSKVHRSVAGLGWDGKDSYGAQSPLDAESKEEIYA